MCGLIRARDDVNWPPNVRFGPNKILPLIASCVMLLWIFVAASLAYSRTAEPHTTAIYWDSPYDDNTAYVMMRIYMLIAETIHLPFHILAYLQIFRGWRLHPIVPVVLCCMLIPVWGWFLAWYALADFIGCECDQSGAWQLLSYVKAFLGGSVVLLYMIYLGVAGRAVHLWRVRTGRSFTNKKTRNEVSSDVGRTQGDSVELRARGSATELANATRDVFELQASRDPAELEAARNSEPFPPPAYEEMETRS